jgi:hypothetical protein
MRWPHSTVLLCVACFEDSADIGVSEASGICEETIGDYCEMDDCHALAVEFASFLSDENGEPLPSVMVPDAQWGVSARITNPGDEAIVVRSPDCLIKGAAFFYEADWTGEGIFDCFRATETTIPAKGEWVAGPAAARVEPPASGAELAGLLRFLYEGGDGEYHDCCACADGVRVE